MAEFLPGFPKHDPKSGTGRSHGAQLTLGAPRVAVKGRHRVVAAPPLQFSTGWPFWAGVHSAAEGPGASVPLVLLEGLPASAFGVALLDVIRARFARGGSAPILGLVKVSLPSSVPWRLEGLGWGDLMILVATLLWSVNVVVVKIALASSGPLIYGSLRFLWGGALLCLIARWRGGPMPIPRGRDVWLLVVAAATGVAVSQAAFNEVLTFANPDFVALVQTTSPLLIVAWLAWRSRERFGPRVWGGFGLGLVGTGLVLTAGGGGRLTWADALLILGLPLTSAVYTLVLPGLLRRYRPLWLTAMITMLGALMLAPLGAVEVLNRRPALSFNWLGLLTYSALGGVVVASLLYTVAVRRLGPARVSAYSYLQPFVCVIAAAILIGEPVLPLQILGGAVIMVGVISGRPRPHQVPDSEEDRGRRLAKQSEGSIVSESVACR